MTSAELTQGNSGSGRVNGMLPADRRALQGAWLFLAALGVFFFASIFLYVIYVFLRLKPEAEIEATPLKLPPLLVLSTVVLLGVSGLIELAYRSARRDREGIVKPSLIIATILAFLFTATQALGMSGIVKGMLQSGSLTDGAHAFTFVMILVHALHVVGGVAALAICAINACRDKYDHERTIGLRLCGLYWHFLDVVWFFMMVAFLIANIALK
ncbi:cytochrome c oxidase subunit 3 [Pirellulaceae bacterium SH449]